MTTSENPIPTSTVVAIKSVASLKPKVTSKTSTKQLRELHRLFSQALYDYMANTPTEDLKPAMLTVVRSFLSDNGVEHSSSVEALELLRKDLAEGGSPTVSDLASLSVPF